MFFESSYLNILSTCLYIVLIFISVILTILGSMIIISRFTKEINEKEEIVRNKNTSIALVFGSFIWSIGNMCLETIKPIMNAWYTIYASGFDFKSGLSLSIKIVFSLMIAIIVGALTIYFSIKILMIIFKNVNEWDEIKNGNLAVAIIIAITVVVVGMFFQPVVSTIVSSILRI